MSTPASPPSDASPGDPDDRPATAPADGARPASTVARDGARPAGGAAAATPGAPASGGGPSLTKGAGDGPAPTKGAGDADGNGTPDHASEADLDDPDAIPDDVAPNARPATRKRVWSIQRRRRKHKGRSKLFRGVYIVVASLIFLLGLVSGPLPGPGPVILIPLGLAMLALEFVWAERALAFALDKAEGAKEGASKASPKQRAFVIAAVILFFAAAISLVFVLDIPIPLLNPNP